MKHAGRMKLHEDYYIHRYCACCNRPVHTDYPENEWSDDDCAYAKTYDGGIYVCEDCLSDTKFALITAAADAIYNALVDCDEVQAAVLADESDDFLADAVDKALERLRKEL